MEIKKNFKDENNHNSECLYSDNVYINEVRTRQLIIAIVSNAIKIRIRIKKICSSNKFADYFHLYCDPLMKL